MNTTMERDNQGQLAAVPAEPPAAPAAEADRNEGRDYVVLKRATQSSPNANNVWENVAVVKASSPEQAVRRAAEQPGTSFLNADGPTTLVAVPSRSFNPLTLTVKVETTISVS